MQNPLLFGILLFMSTQDKERAEIRFSSSRTLRKVPLKWEHPRNEQGGFVPLYDRKTYPHYTEEEIQKGLKDGWIKSREGLEARFAPDFSGVSDEEMGICAYEETTEGTPISPVFPNTSQGRFDLLKHVTENESVFGDVKTDIETWSRILFDNTHAVVDAQRGVVEISPRPAQPVPTK